MNFSELYKKIADLDKPITESDIVGECGPAMGSPTSEQQDSVTMNVSMNGSGSGGIKDILNILRNIEGQDAEMPDMPDMDTPDMGSDIELDIAEPSGMDEPEGDEDALSQIMRLSGKPMAAPEKEVLPGNDGSGEMDDEDKPDEALANSPDENYSDISALTHDNAGGLNAPHQQFKKEYPGDNPMRENLVAKLTAKYNKIRES